MRKRKTSKRQWLWEFSKRLVVAVTFIYVAAIVFSAGFMIAYPDSSAIGIFIEKVTDVFIATVVCYAVKAGFENVSKIRKTPEREEDPEDSFRSEDMNNE